MPQSAADSPIALGTQVVVELYECRAREFDNVEWIREVLEEAARRARATIVQSVFHKFNPYGISGVVVIAESHLAIHTWPEHGYAALDIFTCGPMDREAAIGYISERFKSGHHKATTIARGLPGVNAPHEHLASSSPR